MAQSIRSVLFKQDTKDHHRLPATEKQLAFVRRIAAEHDLRVPDHVLTTRRFVSTWLDVR